MGAFAYFKDPEGNVVGPVGDHLAVRASTAFGLGRRGHRRGCHRDPPPRDRICVPWRQCHASCESRSSFAFEVKSRTQASAEPHAAHRPAWSRRLGVRDRAGERCRRARVIPVRTSTSTTRPPGPRPTGVLLWIHGGGYVMGDPRGDHDVCSQHARDLGIVVVNVDYRLAPEHPFPAALEDCYAALRWVHENADELAGSGPDRRSAAESAGGGLAAALAQLAHDRGEVPVCFQSSSTRCSTTARPWSASARGRWCGRRAPTSSDGRPTSGIRPDSRKSSVRGSSPAGRPQRAAAGVDRRRGHRPVLRGGRRVRGTAARRPAYRASSRWCRATITGRSGWRRPTR